MKSKNVRNSGRSPYNRHVPFIKVVIRLGVLLPVYSGANGFRCVRSPLDGHLRNTRQRFPIVSEGESQIADDENVWITRNSEVGIHFDAAASVSLRVNAFAEF